GYANRRFHLVGHDWGASIAWGIADRYPDRLASLTVLSRPHPNAFNRALQMPDGEQARRSRERLAKSGVPAAPIEQYISVLGSAPAMEAALAWYRARGAIRAPLGVVGVPVLYIWGDADETV